MDTGQLFDHYLETMSIRTFTRISALLNTARRQIDYSKTDINGSSMRGKRTCDGGNVSMVARSRSTRSLRSRVMRNELIRQFSQLANYPR
jgi:hypothetical protein